MYFFFKTEKMVFVIEGHKLKAKLSIKKMDQKLKKCGSQGGKYWRYAISNIINTGVKTFCIALNRKQRFKL